jgi:hypothetical protein
VRQAAEGSLTPLRDVVFHRRRKAVLGETLQPHRRALRKHQPPGNAE